MTALSIEGLAPASNLLAKGCARGLMVNFRYHCTQNREGFLGFVTAVPQERDERKVWPPLRSE
jgi:hypothetical protein